LQKIAKKNTMFHMKKKSIILCFCLMSFIFIQNYNTQNERMIEKDSPLYQDLVLLYAKTNLAPPSSVFPISAKEMQLLIQKIPTKKLDSSDLVIYEKLSDKIATLTQPILGVGAGLNLALEGFYQANLKDFGGTSYDASYGHRDTWDENLIYNYANQKPMVDIPLQFYLPGVYGYTNIQMKNVRQYSKDFFPSLAKGHLFTNVFTSMHYFDMTFPHKAYLSFDGNFYNLLIGRNISEWGNGNSGNLLLGGHLDYYDNIRGTLFSSLFKYTFQATFFDTFFGYVPSTEEDALAMDAEPEFVQYFVSHRFEMPIFNRVNFAFVEGAMVKSRSLQFQSFSPLILLHNSYSYATYNVSMALEADVNLGKGFNAYVQWCSDQLTLQTEIDALGEDIEPQAWGYLAGISYDNSFSWGKFSAFLEFVLTDPYMYLEKDGDRLNQYAYYRAFDNAFYNWNVSQGNMNKGIRKIAKPIGFSYGPDAIVISLFQRFQLRSRWTFLPSITYFIAGENNRKLDYKTGVAANKLRTPSGIPEHNIVTQFGANYAIKDFCSLYGNIGFVQVYNHKNILNKNAFDFQLALGVSLQIHYEKNVK